MPAAPSSFRSLAYGARARIANAIAAAGLAACAIAAPLGASAETVTVLALGDSLTAGYGLPPDQGLVPRLQAWLDANGVEATLVNAGVSGDTTAGGLLRLDWSLTPEVDAMMVILGGNDLLRGLDPAQARANLDAILARAQADGLPVLLVGLRAPGNYGPDYQRAFGAIYADLAQEYDALLEEDFFAAFGTDMGAARSLLQPDGIHPSAEGVARVVEVLGPRIRELAERAAAG